MKWAAVARLLAGESPPSVARVLGVPYATVKHWQGAAFEAARNGHPKKGAAGGALDRLGARLADDLGETLTTNRVLLAALRDPARLDAMGARELAMLHGGPFDRALRLLA